MGETKLSGLVITNGCRGDTQSNLQTTNSLGFICLHSSNTRVKAIKEEF